MRHFKIPNLFTGADREHFGGAMRWNQWADLVGGTTTKIFVEGGKLLK